MENERSVDKLSRYILYTAAAAVVCAACWYFRNVLVYIIVAAVVSLIGRPIKNMLGKIRIRGKSLPAGLLAILTLIVIFTVFLALITQVIPIVSGIVQNVSTNFQSGAELASREDFMRPVERLNEWLISIFPTLGPGFNIQDKFFNFLRNTFSLSSVSSVIGSVASIVVDFAIGIFSVVFISFFFIRDERLFQKIIAALIPDRYETDDIHAIGDIEHLLSRYFVGLIIEVLGVSLLNFLGLLLAARLSFPAAIGIAFMTGILNVIPYVGPWIGAAIGTILGLVLKYSSAVAVGAAFNPATALIVLLAVFVITQLVDNFFYQPMIYSTSIKASPLEIFIVLLVAGHVGGIVGMLVAIPAYTVIRVIASRFFYHIKAIRRLIPDKEEEEAKMHETIIKPTD